MDFASPAKKLRIFLLPFFATGHIIPIFELSRLLGSHPNVEPTLLLSPANAALIHASLTPSINLVIFPFPSADLNLPPGAENISSVPSSEAWKLDKAVNLVQSIIGPIILANPPDVIIADGHYWWALHTAKQLNIPALTFFVIGAFPELVLRNLLIRAAHVDGDIVTVPGLPGPAIVIPRSELPSYLTSTGDDDFKGIVRNVMESASLRFGVVSNTFYELEPAYCDVYKNSTFFKRSWFVGPVAAYSGAGDSVTEAENGEGYMSWLGNQKASSVVYVCFGSWCHFSNQQLTELAVGLDQAGTPFLWVVRGGSEEWLPAGWEERVNGKLVRGWAPQVKILKHEAVGAFLTHCGWNSVLEAAVAGVAMLTWPLVFEQFINERLVVGVMGAGARLWEGERSTEEEKKVLVPAQAIAKAVRIFMEGGGVGELARRKAKEYAEKAKAAVADGGSSRVDLNKMIDELTEAKRCSGN